MQSSSRTAFVLGRVVLKGLAIFHPAMVLVRALSQRLGTLSARGRLCPQPHEAFSHP